MQTQAVLSAHGIATQRELQHLSRSFGKRSGAACGVSDCCQVPSAAASDARASIAAQSSASTSFEGATQEPPTQIVLGKDR